MARPKGYKHTEETKQRMGESAKKRGMSRKCIKAGADARRGKPAWNRNITMEDSDNWKGGCIRDRGRVKIYVGNNKYKFRSRIVAEEMIGRPLKPNEQVHHRNCIKDDDRPENLQVMTINEHTALHHKLGTL